MNTKKMSALVIDALEDIKAKNILVLNVSKLTSMFDYIVIASGDSNRQTRALANNVREKLKEAGAHVYGSEGEDTGEWVLVDLGDIVVHIMQPVTREYYRLEELWREGKVEFPKPQKSKAEDDEADEKSTKAAKPATRKTAAKDGAGKKPAAKKPTTRKAAGSTSKTSSGTRKPAAKKPAAKSAIDKSTTAKKPAAKSPATTKPATAKPAAKKPAAPRTKKTGAG
jgi:ribosome-associated protein